MSPTQHLERMSRARLIDRCRRAGAAAMRHRAEAEATARTLARVAPGHARDDLDVVIGLLAQCIEREA